MCYVWKGTLLTNIYSTTLNYTAPMDRCSTNLCQSTSYIWCERRANTNYDRLAIVEWWWTLEKRSSVCSVRLSYVGSLRENLPVYKICDSWVATLRYSTIIICILSRFVFRRRNRTTSNYINNQRGRTSIFVSYIDFDGVFSQFKIVWRFVSFYCHTNTIIKLQNALANLTRVNHFYLSFTTLFRNTTSSWHNK